ncbi:hypothetical protein GBF38_021728 [Nibea albiflora]|uniref:Uncharacterized protein n=1 Tax=Nibea albiflora TaxID=240163 RepID=A0ACB7FGV6_NIBAL|nr:hypothetical protein GBF38_021728 [Nibea albiflora]
MLKEFLWMRNQQHSGLCKPFLFFYLWFLIVQSGPAASSLVYEEDSSALLDVHVLRLGNTSTSCDDRCQQIQVSLPETKQ